MHTPNTTRPCPAIIAGAELNGLGILRSLSAAGVPTLVLDSDNSQPGMRSRHGKKIQVPSLEGQAFMDSLHQIMQTTPQAVLFLTEEKTVRTVSELRSQLPAGIRIRLPAHERLMALMHKQGFQDLAEQQRALLPKMVRLEGWDDLSKVATLRYPCIFKPGKKDYTYGARFKKAYKVSSPAEIETLYRDIHPVLADMVVQEWIEGEDSEIYFCLQYIGEDGQLVASFVGRKIRSWPLRVGGTASCTAAWEEYQELTDTTLHFFRATGFSGMGSMEYKRDSRDGKFYMVEPTVARTDFQEEVATVNGVNLPLAAYLHELSLPQELAPRPDKPITWRDPLSDKWAFQENGGRPDPRSQGNKVMDAYWRLNDPQPWLDFMTDRIKWRLGLHNSKA